MPSTRSPENDSVGKRGLRADWPFFVYDHWHIDENGHLAWETMMLPDNFIDIINKHIEVRDKNAGE